MRAITLFQEMYADWQSALPPLLRREDPVMLIRFLNLCTSSEGILQSELKRQLGANQPRVSKLTRKLVQARWIQVKTPEIDERRRLAVITPVAKKKLAELESRWLTRVSPKPATKRSRTVRRSTPVAVGQTGFDLEMGLGES